MNGPGHYYEAERLLAMGEDSAAYDRPFNSLLQAAQVHATLALAAATGLAATGDYFGATSEQYRGWAEVTA